VLKALDGLDLMVFAGRFHQATEYALSSTSPNTSPMSPSHDKLFIGARQRASRS